MLKMLETEQILQEQYQLKKKLADHIVRQTWLIEDLQVSHWKDRQAILKLLLLGGPAQWENLKLFEREAQVLRELHHAQIPRYRDYFCIDDSMLWFGLVEEYIPGKSLKQMLEHGQKFTEPEVRQIAKDVLLILIYLHELSPAILHRDIKPSNLILGDRHQVYLIDFGSVQEQAPAEGASLTVVGTYGYTPMEQFGGRAVPASDLYSLGATLIHLLTGTAPANLPQRSLRIQFREHVSLSSNFVGWIEKLTEPVPEQRFSTAREALNALESESNISFAAQHQNSFPVTSTSVDINDLIEEKVQEKKVKSYTEWFNKLRKRGPLGRLIYLCLKALIYGMAFIVITVTSPIWVPGWILLGIVGLIVYGVVWVIRGYYLCSQYIKCYADPELNRLK